ncbi:thermonuclease family protein [Ottowia sp.]|uniref:thermonuclease family protein n=1 Tax=Ottowia sp. TaxID=1898956 RepID=UPI002BBFFEFE|nr:thermonuclease family protein [Ottowia sp.]HOB66777.1 thermonuclease family protein [Ottowia sp.]HPZ57341.1 thermonuclease family protein [Ottowia sp.]HQD48104.1 thermonuclease family protein [Ottowia sp.]
MTARALAVRCVALAGLWLALPAAAQDGAGPQTGVPWLARVSYVVDGDSIWVWPEGGGNRVRLRIDGVDAPEICQVYGAESRQALQALALNQRVRVTVWARDRYGRAIASVVRLDGDIDLGEHMVAEGWAWTDGWGARLGKYWRAEAQARWAGRGLFAQGWPELPADFRRRHGPCTPGQPTSVH